MTVIAAINVEAVVIFSIVLSITLGIMYLRRADRDYDPLAARVVEMATQPREGGRFARAEEVRR